MRAHYNVAEASSGTTPTTTADEVTTGGAVDLTVDFQGGNWTSIAAGNGVELDADGEVTANPNSTKIEDLNGTTSKLVLRMVGTYVTASTTSIRWGLTGTGAYYIRMFGTGFRFYDGANELRAAALHGLAANGVHVWTCEIDFTEATATDRVKFYQDGVQLTTLDVGLGIPAQNTTIDFTATSELQGGPADGDTQSIYSLTIQTDLLGSTEEAAQASALLADNDADPDGGAPEPPVVVAVDHSSTLSFPCFS